jgi:alkanesulfonate monooxygenase SsuD/methylene tetrahydromethanopterin reductase-like flavin-dependent oxidoreductase (luciferase family)
MVTETHKGAVQMQYGVYLPNFGPYGDARCLGNLAADAENAGWDGFFIWDHIARPMVVDVVDPWIALAAIALQTSRIRIGALITPIPRRRPWKLARETVSIDRLSNGRLIVGVGIGSGKPEEWDHFGEEIDPKKRGAMLDEGLEILTGLWRGEPYSFQGQHYQVGESLFLPTPIQSPRIPIWVGGYGLNKPPLRRAAQFDGVFPIFDSPDLSRLPKQAIDYTLSHRNSDAPFDIVFNGHTPPDHIAAEKFLQPFHNASMTWWLENIYPIHYGSTWDGTWDTDAMRARILQGPPKS